MVKHIIFFTLKPEADKAAVIAAAQAALMPLVGKIPGLTKMEVKESFAGADFVLYSELESREALAVYANHPLHLAAKTHFFPWVQTRTAADYEVSEERMTKAVVTVVGKDRVGIIANVCTALAGFQVNVLDINQTVMQGYFTMMMVVEVSACNVPLGDLVTGMEQLGREMGLSIRVQREDIFEAMHRI